MAPPALESLDNYCNASFRDTVIRNQSQVASSANIIQKLYHHVTGNTANLSVAEVVSVDGSQQGQWDLMLSTTGNRLDANTITTATTGVWSGNSIMSVRRATTTFRSANVVVGNLTVNGTFSTTSNVSGTTITGTNLVGTLQTAAQPNITSVGTLSSLGVSGNASVTNVHANQVVNTGTAYRIGNTNVLTSTALGTSVVSSSLTSVGTLTSLNVSGAITGQLATAAQPNVTSVGILTSLHVSGGITGQLATAAQPNVTSVGTLSSLNVSGDTDIGLTLRRQYTLTIPAPGSALRFVSFESQYGTYLVEIFLRQSRSANSIAKHYKFTVRTNATTGQWRDLLPLVDDGPGGNDINMWIKSGVQGGGNSFFTQLRIGRKFADANVQNENVLASVVIHRAPEGFNILTQNDVVSDPMFVMDESYVYNYYDSTKLCTTRNGVCIDAVDPLGNKLYVNGDARVDGTLDTGFLVAGDVRGTNMTTESHMGFADKWRISYNEETDRLEIQRNTGTSEDPVWVMTAILAQM